MPLEQDSSEIDNAETIPPTLLTEYPEITVESALEFIEESRGLRMRQQIETIIDLSTATSDDVFNAVGPAGDVVFASSHAGIEKLTHQVFDISEMDGLMSRMEEPSWTSKAIKSLKDFAGYVSSSLRRSSAKN